MLFKLANSKVWNLLSVTDKADCSDQNIGENITDGQ